MLVKRVATIEMRNGIFYTIALHAVVSEEVNVQGIEQKITIKRTTDTYKIIPISVDGLNETEKALDRAILNHQERIADIVLVLDELQKRGYEINLLDVDC
ncbi:MAG: hypothetical protein QXG39_09010 [Candidatus Aenigmatarchaeota archaeon]